MTLTATTALVDLGARCRALEAALGRVLLHVDQDAEHDEDCDEEESATGKCMCGHDQRQEDLATASALIYGTEAVRRLTVHRILLAGLVERIRAHCAKPQVHVTVGAFDAQFTMIDQAWYAELMELVRQLPEG